MIDAKPSVDDLSLTDYGYAPGGYYHGGCFRCRAAFMGDKRAITCHDCATEMHNEDSQR